MNDSQNKMNIVFLTPCFPSETDPYPGVFIKKIASSLKTNQINITVIHPIPCLNAFRRILPKSLRQLADLPFKTVTEDGIAVYRPRYLTFPKSTVFGYTHISIIHTIDRLLRTLNLNPTIIHGHFLYPLGLCAARLAKRYHAHSVASIRGDDINCIPRFLGLARKRVEEALSSCDALTSVSYALAKKARQYTKKDIAVIYNGTNISKTPSLGGDNYVRRELKIAQEAFMVLFVGALTESKGFHLIIDAARTLLPEDITFVLAGPPTNASRVDMPSNCLVLGTLNTAEICQLMRAANVLILPSRREGMPNVLVEAASLGLPIVAANVGGVAELIDQTTGILLENNTSTELIQAILAVKCNYLDAQKRAENAKRRAEHLFDLDTNAKQLIALYEGLVNH
jgi:teichuronic acid biosynthesis glycosyltransferase TuaC